MMKKASVRCYGGQCTTSFPLADETADLRDGAGPFIDVRFKCGKLWRALGKIRRRAGKDIREGDVGAILGWGFAWSGGPFSWLDSSAHPMRRTL